MRNSVLFLGALSLVVAACGSGSTSNGNDDTNAVDATGLSDSTGHDTHVDSAVADTNAADSAIGDAQQTSDAVDSTTAASDATDSSVTKVIDSAATDAGVDTADSQVADTGVADTGHADTGPADTGVVDTGPADTGSGWTPPPCDFTTTSTCQLPEQNLGTVDGDENSDSVSASFYGSEYFQAYVYEDCDWDVSLSYSVSLTVPAGMSYNLYVYEGSSSGLPSSCTTPTKTGTLSGSTLTLSNSWGDNYGSDDSRYLVIYVQYVSGTLCAASNYWTLTLKGNSSGNSCSFSL